MMKDAEPKATEPVELSRNEIASLQMLQLTRENLQLKAQLLEASEWRIMAEICARAGMPLQALDIDLQRGLALPRTPAK